MPDEMYSCEEVLLKLADFVDRELIDSEIAFVETHLSYCPECKHAVRWEGQILKKLADCCQSVEKPDALLERIMKAIPVE